MILIMGLNFIFMYVEGMIDFVKLLCVFGGGVGVFGGVVVSSVLIMCEFLFVEFMGVVECWVMLCFEECDFIKVLFIGLIVFVLYTRVALMFMA